MKTARIERISNKLPSSGQHVAVVIDRCQTGWLLHETGKRFVARKAASCLLIPEPGDSVLVCVVGNGVWILAVLERDESRASIIETTAGLSLRPGSGKIDLFGPDGVSVSSGDAITMESPRLQVSARLAKMVTGKLSWLGERLDARFDGVRMVGRLFDSVLERFSRKARRSYRHTEEVDQVRSGQIDYRSAKNMTLRGRNVLTKAEELAKFDGDQIHLG